MVAFAHNPLRSVENRSVGSLDPSTHGPDGAHGLPAADTRQSERRQGTGGDAGNDLMIALQNGDRVALQRMIALYNGRLYSFVVRIVGDAATAEDITQETWLALYERRASYHPTHKFSTWLFTIARRKALSELRRRSVRSVVRSLTVGNRQGGEAEQLEMPQQTFFAPDESTDGTILSAMVERALSRLTPQQREIVILRDIEEFENEEIAEILRWSLKPGAIRKRVFDAREAFRREMIQLGYSER